MLTLPSDFNVVNHFCLGYEKKSNTFHFCNIHNLRDLLIVLYNYGFACRIPKRG